MDGVYSCCDRTESEGISDIVVVVITETSEVIVVEVVVNLFVVLTEMYVRVIK